MLRKEITKLIELIESADLMMLVIGDKKAALGTDVVELIVTALNHFNESEDARTNLEQL